MIRTIAIIITGILFLVLLLAILYFMPSESIWIAAGVLLTIIVYFFLSRLIQGQKTREEKPNRLQNVASLLIIFLIVFILFAIYLNGIVSSIAITILLVSLIFTMVMNFLTVPLAIVHKIKQKKEELAPTNFFPKVTIIVPAYNEEKVVARTIETLLEAEYPYREKEIIIVDDGSQDSTYEVASKYSDRGVKVVHRPNGGKFAALNTGLAFATGEIVVTVDADSLIARASIREIVKGFQDPEVAGVAGNLKVFNRKKLITKLQALEYVVQIQIVRRAFENFGSLTVASGAFSAFRRSALVECGAYDPDFLLEDFDITIKLLKSHRILSGNNEAVCYTEAPETLRDIYRQRLSWFRGDYQNFWKHRDTFFNPRFGILHKLTFPYMLISMTLVPFASMVVIVTSLVMLIYGEWLTLVLAFVLFLILQTLLSLVSVLVAEDDLKLVLLSPLFVFGYKQFLDLTMIKALIDIVLGGGTYRRRERVTRIGDAPGKSTPAAKIS
ncbi:MAG: glycosyltransferase family 2 protein [Chloroflexi bacterium]|nr:glycosyltransferase family 2 protein [Chloroflexota bacterium]